MDECKRGVVIFGRGRDKTERNVIGEGLNYQWVGFNVESENGSQLCCWVDEESRIQMQNVSAFIEVDRKDWSGVWKETKQTKWAESVWMD